MIVSDAYPALRQVRDHLRSAVLLQVFFLVIAGTVTCPAAASVGAGVAAASSSALESAALLPATTLLLVVDVLLLPAALSLLELPPISPAAFAIK